MAGGEENVPRPEPHRDPGQKLVLTQETKRQSDTGLSQYLTVDIKEELPLEDINPLALEIDWNSLNENVKD